MGLEAFVFCDCVETNRLKKPHPYPKQLYIERNGSPEIRSVDASKIDKHDAWMATAPCKHDELTVVSSYLGNAGLIELIRDALMSGSSLLPPCPILLNKVLYSGTHTGDFLAAKQVMCLFRELQRLKGADLRAAGLSKEQIKRLRSLIAELDRISKSALKLNKPIAF